MGGRESMIPFLSEDVPFFQVRGLVLALLLGRQLVPGLCRNWNERHTRIIREHGLGPWLYSGVRDRLELEIPPALSSFFHNEYRRSVVASLIREGILSRVAEELHRRGVSPAGLKGAYLMSKVYEDPALRPMGDLDLLVPEGDFRTALQIIEEMGYRKAYFSPDGYHFAIQPSVSLIRNKPPGDCIDLHFGIRLMDYYRFPSRILWENMIEDSIHGVPLRHMSPELNFIHIGVHLLNHGGALRDWLDLALLMRRADISWRRVTSLARDLGVLRPVYWVCRGLAPEWGPPTAPEIMKELADYVPNWLEDRVICRRSRYMWRTYSRIRSLDGWKNRFGYLRSRMFPTREHRLAVTGTTGLIPYAASKVGYLLRLWRKW
ncbi:MAG: nucleotidyltransferase family protein [Pseudomonadota bacterium]